MDAVEKFVECYRSCGLVLKERKILKRNVYDSVFPYFTDLEMVSFEVRIEK